jgi:hypothetical protein
VRPEVPATAGDDGALWPTPSASVAQIGEGADTWLARRERLKVTVKNGNGAGMPLTVAVQCFPSGLPGRTTAVPPDAPWTKGWPDPNWVDWLMGFPPGWTDPARPLA